MEVKIKLFGTLRLKAEDYKPSQGMAVEIPDGATVRKLLEHLEISETRGAVVIAGGRVLKAHEEIPHDVTVNVFQSIQGG